MNKKLASCLLGTMITIVPLASFAAACGDYGVSTIEFENGVTQQDRLITVDSEGSLVSINRFWGTTRNFGDFDRKLSPKIDVQGDRVFVATDTEVCEISLKTGKLIRAHKHSHGPCGVGIITARKVFLNNGRSIAIMDMSNGATLHKLDLMENTKSEEVLADLQPHIQHTRNGDLLYIARPCTFGIAVVDLKNGKRLQDINIPNMEYTDRLHYSEGQLFVINYALSYSIRCNETLSLVDIKTETVKKTFPLGNPVPSFAASLDINAPTKMVAVNGGGILVSSHRQTLQVDKQGNIIN